jgi:hypothetical protein
LVSTAFQSTVLLVPLFARQHLDAGGLEGLLDFVGETFAVGSRVIDDGDELGLVLAGEVTGNRRTLLVVTADDAEHALEALLGQRRIGGGTRDHRQAGLVVDGRGGNRGAGIEMADNAGNLGVDQLLRHGVAYLRVFLVVFRQQLELDLPAAEADARGIGFIDCEAGAIFVVLAQVCDASGERSDAADLYHQRRRGWWWRGRRGRFFLAASHQGDCGNDGKREGLFGEVHDEAPFRSGTIKW